MRYGKAVCDADYRVQIREELPSQGGKRKAVTLWKCPYYSRWCAILQRSLSTTWKVKYPSYKDCTICEEWLLFSNFRDWVVKQEILYDMDIEECQVDKDILVEGSKMYCPESCCLVEQHVNKFINEHGNRDRKYMVGVTLSKNKERYRAQCNKWDDRTSSWKRVAIGVFDSEQEAHLAWIECKLSEAKRIAKDISNKDLGNALIMRYYNMKLTSKGEEIMSELNMFEQAVRNKLRFETTSGFITVEDLWDLKLTGGRLSLDNLAKSLNKQIKEEEEESFVVKKSQSNKTLDLKFEIVKYIIDVKIKEYEVSKKALDDKARKEKLLSLLAEKQDDNDKNKSEEELLAELEALNAS